MRAMKVTGAVLGVAALLALTTVGTLVTTAVAMYMWA